MAENMFSILLKAILDENASAREIKRQIDNLSEKASDVKLGVKIDDAEIERLRREISNIQKELEDTNLTTKERNRLLKEMNQLQRTLNTEARVYEQQTKQDLAHQRTQLSEITAAQKDAVALKRSQQQLAKMENAEIEKENANLREQKSLLSSMKTWHSKQTVGSMSQTGMFGVNEVGELRTAQNAYDQLISQIESGNISLKDARTEFQLLKDGITQLGDTVKKVDEIQLSFDNGHGDSDYQNRITAITNELTKYGLSTDEANKKTENLRTILDGFKVNGNFLPDEQLVAQANKLEAEFKAVKVSVDSAKLSFDKFLQPVSSEKASSLIVRINSFLSKNTAITAEAKAELQSFVAQLNSGVNLGEWNKFNLRLKEIEDDMRKAGKLGKSLKQTLIEGAKSFAQWTLSSGAVMELWQGLKNMAKAVYDIDTAMTNLYKVTAETANRYDKFLNNACKNAERLGRTVSSLVEQTANWSKLGFSLDEAEKLAEISSIYANVGEVSDDTAVSDMVTAMKAFNIEASDAITIVDRLNALGNKYATSAADLGTGLSNSASSLALAGNNIDETLAMITAMTEITQDASESGNALKILSMRLRGMKGELEALGEESEGLESISKIQTQILNLTGGKVNIFDDTGNFKSTYEIMQDISDIWTEISQTDQAELLEIIAGKQRGNSISALLTNMTQANNALNDSINSSGSAYEEQSRWMESMEAKTAQFDAAFQSLSNTILDNSLLKGIVDFGTGTISILDDIIGKFGALNTITTIGSGILGAKGLGLTNYVTQS